MKAVLNTRRTIAGVVLVVSAICGAPSVALADHVVLTNSDALTGRVAVVSKSEIAVDTELAGRVTVKWSAVSRLSSAVAVRATLADGRTVEGTLVMAEGHLTIHHADGRSVAVDLATVRALDLASAATGAAWHGALNAGWDASRGNAETATISTNGTATRAGLHDRLGIFGTYLFSAVGSGADAVTTARDINGGVRYDHDLRGRLFGFGFGDAENDPLQLLDLRTVVGGGAGAHVLKTDATQLNVFGGLSYARDAYAAGTTTTVDTGTVGSGAGRTVTPPGQGGTPPGQSGIKPSRGGTPPTVVRTSLSRNVGELLAGQDLSHQLSDTVNLSERFTVFPAIGNAEDYRVSFDLSLSAQLNGWLQWNFTGADRYLHIPPAGGAVQNDVFISTGLGITFGRGGGGDYTGSDARRPASPRE